MRDWRVFKRIPLNRHKYVKFSIVCTVRVLHRVIPLNGIEFFLKSWQSPSYWRNNRPLIDLQISLPNFYKQHWTRSSNMDRRLSSRSIPSDFPTKILCIYQCPMFCYMSHPSHPPDLVVQQAIMFKPKICT
jgi:hypothetical protein